MPRGEEDEEWKMRGNEGEKKQWGEERGWWRKTGPDREKNQKQKEREKPGEPKGSIGGEHPKSPHTTTLLQVRRVDGGDDAPFINICRRTLNSSLVANENRYRVCS